MSWQQVVLWVLFPLGGLGFLVSIVKREFDALHTKIDALPAVASDPDLQTAIDRTWALASQVADSFTISLAPTIQKDGLTQQLLIDTSKKATEEVISLLHSGQMQLLIKAWGVVGLDEVKKVIAHGMNVAMFNKLKRMPGASP